MAFYPEMISGRNLSPDGGKAAHEVLLGSSLARSLDVKPGDGLTMLAVTSDGALNGIDVDVVGTFTTGFKEMDDRAVRLTLPPAQQLLQSDRVSKLVVGLDRTENTDTVYPAVLSRIEGRGVILKKWVELAPVYRQVRIWFGAIFLFMCTIVCFMVVMSSANTMMM